MPTAHLHDGRTVELSPRRGLIYTSNRSSAEPWTGQAYELFFRLAVARADQEDPLVTNKDLVDFKNVDNLVALINRRLSPHGGHRYVVSVKGRGRVFNPWSPEPLGKLTHELQGSWAGCGWLIAPQDPGTRDASVTETFRKDLWEKVKKAASLRFDYRFSVAADGPYHLGGEAEVRSVRVLPNGSEDVVWNWDPYTIEMWPSRFDDKRLTARFASRECRRWSDEGAGSMTVENTEAGGSGSLIGLFAANKLIIPGGFFSTCDLGGIEVIRIRFEKVQG